jgi:hypothetical protein
MLASFVIQICFKMLYTCTCLCSITCLKNALDVLYLWSRYALKMLLIVLQKCSKCASKYDIGTHSFVGGCVFTLIIFPPSLEKKLLPRIMIMFDQVDQNVTSWVCHWNGVHDIPRLALPCRSWSPNYSVLVWSTPVRFRKNRIRLFLVL